MINIGLYYGSTTGQTHHVAQAIQQQLHAQFNISVELLDVAEYYFDDLPKMDAAILGMPTWNVGQLQSDWEEVIDDLDALDLSEMPIALFGLGDQVGYPDTFVDALIFIVERIEAQGARLVGQWPIDGYTFNSSWAIRDNHFVGLVLDEENQADLTGDRVKRWVRQIGVEFGLHGESAVVHHDNVKPSTQ